LALWQQIFAAVGVVGGLTGLAALLLVPSQRRKAQADAASVIVDSAVDLLEPLRTEVADAKAKARELTAELRKAERIVRLIRRELERPAPSVQKLREIVGVDLDM